MRFSYRWYNGDICRYASIDNIEAYLKKKQNYYYVNDYLLVRYVASDNIFEGKIMDTNESFCVDKLYPLLKHAYKNNISYSSFTNLSYEDIYNNVTRRNLFNILIEILLFHNKFTKCIEHAEFIPNREIISIKSIGNHLINIRIGRLNSIITIDASSDIQYDKSIFSNRMINNKGIIELFKHIYEDNFM